MTLEALEIKHRRLRKLDGGGFFKGAFYKTFGSGTHQYKFNACLALKDVEDFENTHQIKLPVDYRNFITLMGNGGSGPAYGLLPLSEWNIELEINGKNFLQNEFPYIDKWNMDKEFDTKDEDCAETEVYQQWEEEYYSNKHVTGSIRICHYGCAIYYLLIISGVEAGNIWVDDRASDYGIYPATSKQNGQRLRFFEWYDEWLTEGLEQYA